MNIRDTFEKLKQSWGVIALEMTDEVLYDLMDLRVDYAFKQLFAEGDTKSLISLLNAIFVQKQIPRIITSLTTTNPISEKLHEKDKPSILDIRAILDDNTHVLIEMHLYDITAHKYKTMRSWARVYGGQLNEGQKFTEQNTVIHISFLDGAVTYADGKPIKKVHSLFHIMERDDHEILSPDMEMHYINMKAFEKQIKELLKRLKETGYKEKLEIDDFTAWLAFIIQKEIKDKDALRTICDRKELSDAMKALALISSDENKRLDYQRRMDELHTYNYAIRKMENEIKQNKAEIKQNKAEIKQSKAEIKQSKAEIKQKNAVIADKDAKLADKDAKLAALMAEIAALRKGQEQT